MAKTVLAECNTRQSDQKPAFYLFLLFHPNKQNIYYIIITKFTNHHIHHRDHISHKNHITHNHPKVHKIITYITKFTNMSKFRPIFTNISITNSQTHVQTKFLTQVSQSPLTEDHQRGGRLYWFGEGLGKP
jgi:hypothetical protein